MKPGSVQLAQRLLDAHAHHEEAAFDLAHPVFSGNPDMRDETPLALYEGIDERLTPHTGVMSAAELLGSAAALGVAVVAERHKRRRFAKALGLPKNTPADFVLEQAEGLVCPRQ